MTVGMELDAHLENISESLTAVSTALRNVKEGALKAHDGHSENHRVSLLSLKNGTLLGYVSALLGVVGAKLDPSGRDPSATSARSRAIEHRVVLERGIKPLERRLEYQLDKLVRAYQRAQDTASAAAARRDTRLGARKGDDSEDEDELSYRPGAINSTPADAKDPEEQQQEDAPSGYRPPKVNSVLPPSERAFEDKFQVRDPSRRARMQAMDEYIREAAEMPETGASIGADIVAHGRGGVKTLRDTDREREMTRYEEDNFTRVHMNKSKADKKRMRQRERNQQLNTIGGEDFGIFHSKRRLEESTGRGSKRSRTAWDRAKRRI